MVLVGGGLFLAGVASGCSLSLGTASLDDRVDEAVAEKTATLLEVDEADVEVDCEEPPDEEAGTNFGCASSAAGQDPIRWQVRLGQSGSFDALTINLVTAEAFNDLEALVAENAASVLGAGVTAADVDCGQGPQILGRDLTIECVVSGPGGDPVPAVIVLTDVTETGDDETNVASIEIGTQSEAAAALIAAESEALGLGEVQVDCDDPPSQDVGTTFECRSTAELGVVSWVVTIEEDDNIGVVTTNLIRADVADRIEAAAVASLEAETGQALGVENFDCGPGPFVLDERSAIVCALTSPTSGEVFDAVLTFTDLDTGAFQVLVADEPRA